MENNENLEFKDKASFEEPLIPVDEPKTVKPRRELKLPEEPTAEHVDATRLIFRMPLTGERIQRYFLKTDSIQTLYDFVDHLQYNQKCKFEGVEDWTDDYTLVQSMPRKMFADKDKTIEETGLFPKGAIL